MGGKGSGIYKHRSGFHLTQEHKDRLVEVNRGSHHTEATKQKIRETNIKTWKAKKAAGYKNPGRPKKSA